MANTDVTWKHPEYEAREAQLKLVNTIYAGVDDARSLLSKLRNESDTSYDTRVVECTLDNFVERIVTTMAGQITRKNVTYEDIPDNIVETWKLSAVKITLTNLLKI